MTLEPSTVANRSSLSAAVVLPIFTAFVPFFRTRVTTAEGLSRPNGFRSAGFSSTTRSCFAVVAAETSGRLFRWVAWFTGSKNAMKGFGFFLGGVLLQILDFRLSLWVMAAALGLILLGVVSSLPPMMGKAKASSSARELFGKSKGVNLLAAARVALFGARDVWFVVGVPVFLYANGWTFTMVGGFMAVWTIFYGLIQASAPAVIRRSADGLSREVPAARLWSALLAAVPALMIAALALNSGIRPDLVLVTGLGLFGVAFAINSSVHSYLDSDPFRLRRNRHF